MSNHQKESCCKKCNPIRISVENEDLGQTVCLNPSCPCHSPIQDWREALGLHYERLVKLYKVQSPNGNIADEAAYDHFLELKNLFESAIATERETILGRLEARMWKTDNQSLHKYQNDLIRELLAELKS